MLEEINGSSIFQDSKLRQPISQGSGMLEDRTVTIVHGTDFTSVSYTNFCAFKAEVALFWATELANYIRYHRTYLCMT
jgi:hypothetical protein